MGTKAIIEPLDPKIFTAGMFDRMEAITNEQKAEAKKRFDRAKRVRLIRNDDDYMEWLKDNGDVIFKVKSIGFFGITFDNGWQLTSDPNGYNGLVSFHRIEDKFKYGSSKFKNKVKKTIFTMNTSIQESETGIDCNEENTNIISIKDWNGKEIDWIKEYAYFVITDETKVENRNILLYLCDENGKIRKSILYYNMRGINNE